MRDIFLRFDFGTSTMFHIPVLDVIGQRIGNTIRLSALTVLLTYLIAIPLGLIAGRKRDRLPDRGIMLYTFVALSLPTVILAIINLLVFGFNFGWFPTSGSVDIRAYYEGGFALFTSRLHHLILPAITLALLSTMSIIYFLRSEIIDCENSDFVLTARAKGVPEGTIYRRHIMRNAFLPVAGGMGGIIVTLFSGSIFAETIFAYPGMGQLFITSIVARDFPVANTLIIFFAVLSVVAMLLSDILITVIDPRIRIE
jgi:peptide/nickel transport system permease protein